APSDREEPATPMSPPSTPLQLDQQQIVAAPPIFPAPTQTPSNRKEPGPPISPASTPLRFNQQQIVAGTPISPEPAQASSHREEPKPPISMVPTRRQLDGEEIAVLLKRGKDLIATGDLAAARLVLQRAADANDVEATLALA